MGAFDDLIPGGGVVLGTGAGGGKSGMSGVENKELVEARSANQQGRDIFPSLAKIYSISKRYPGGIPQAVYDQARLSTGSQNETAQDYELFDKMAYRAGLAKAALLRPVSNVDVVGAVRSGANPRMRFPVNRELIGVDYSNAARQYFDNALKSRFAAKTGGTNVPLNGKSYDEVLAEAMRRPEVRRLVTPPWLRKSAPKTRGPKGDTNGDGVIDFNDMKD